MGACCSRQRVVLQFHNPTCTDIHDRSSPFGRVTQASSVRENRLNRYLSRRPSTVQLQAIPTRSLFDKLPDNVLKRVFELVPSSTRVQMRCVCKRWNAFILSAKIPPRCYSGKHVLFNFGAADLTLRVYSPRATHWELEGKSLSFLLDTGVGDPADARPIWSPSFSSRWLRLVACGGGLLCLTSSLYFWAFIVCNPLTRKWRRLQMPFANGHENSMPPPPWAAKLKSSKSMSRVMDWQAKLDEELAVGMIVDPDSNRDSYKLIVAGLYEGSERATLVYDSRTSVWKKIADVPLTDPSKESRFCSRAITCNGNFYCLAGEFQDRYAVLRRPTRLLKCDMRHERWIEVVLPTELGFPNDLVEHCGRVLLLTHDRYNIGNSLSFYELREFDGAEMSFSPTELPETLTSWLNSCRRQSNFHFSVRCLGIGNVMYISTKMDKDHKVLVYNALDKTCITTTSPQNADYIYDAGWNVFTPALHAAV